MAQGRTERGRAGFTLVEILLALAAMCIVLAAAHEVLTATVRRTDAVYRTADDRAAAATLCDIIRRELSGLYPLRGEEPPFVLSVPLGRAAGGMEVAFATSTPALELPQQQAPAVRRVTYRLGPSRGGRGGYALYRAVRAFPGEREPAARGELLADGLSAFEVAAYDGARWRTEWPPDEGKGLPRAVRVRFEMERRRAEVLVAVEVAPERRGGER